MGQQDKRQAREPSSILADEEDDATVMEVLKKTRVVICVFCLFFGEVIFDVNGNPRKMGLIDAIFL